MKTYLTVKKVKALDDFKLLLTFSNAETRVFDMSPYLNKGMFRELKNISLFTSVHISFDTIEWDNGADFDPEDLFALSKKVDAKKYSQALNMLPVAAESKGKYNSRKVT